MSEKAVLINKIPPVAKSELPASSSSAVVGATAVPAKPEVTISSLQATTYALNVLSFVLAGCMAVVLFRAATKSIGAHLSSAAKLLAAAFGFSALYGLFATYLYRNYLYDAGLGAPLAAFFALWVVLGGIVGAVLVKVQVKDAKVGALISIAGAFAAAFFCSVLALSLSANENAALGLSLLAITILFIVALQQIQSSQVFKRKNPNLCQAPFQIMVYLLAALPLAISVLGLLSALGTLTADLSLLIYQVILCGFIASVGVLMLRCVSKDANLAPVGAESAPVKAPAQKQEAAHFDPLIAQMKQEDAAIEEAQIKTADSPVADQKPEPTSKEKTKKDAPSPEVKANPNSESEVKKPAPPKAPEKKAPVPPAPQKTGARPNLKAPSKPQKRF